MLGEILILAAMLCPQAEGTRTRTRSALEPRSYDPATGWPVRDLPGRGRQQPGAKASLRSTPGRLPASQPSRPVGPRAMRRLGTPFDAPNTQLSGFGQPPRGFAQRQQESATPIYSDPNSVSRRRIGEGDQAMGRDSRRARGGGQRGLADVFRVVGKPEALGRLVGAMAWNRFTVLTDDGRELGMIEVKHRMDFRRPNRDRLSYEGGLVYGRDGSTAFVEFHGVARPERVPDAREELEIFGLLARFPWCFADSAQFRVSDAQPVRSSGDQPMVRIRVESRIEVGAGAGRQKADVYEIYCDAATMEPVRLVYTLAASGSERVVVLSDYRAYGMVRVPMRRQFLDSMGRPTFEIDILELTTGIEFHESEFHPSR